MVGNVAPSAESLHIVNVWTPAQLTHMGKSNWIIAKDQGEHLYPTYQHVNL